MTCTYCGTELPIDALFCGECGRAVSPFAQRVQRMQVPAAGPVNHVEQLRENEIKFDLSEPSYGQPSYGQPSYTELPFAELSYSSPVRREETGVDPIGPTRTFSTPTAPASEGASSRPICQTCGATLADDEIFCGECGAVSKAAAENYNHTVFSRPRDTQIIEPVSPFVASPPFLATPPNSLFDIAPGSIPPLERERQPRSEVRAIPPTEPVAEYYPTPTPAPAAPAPAPTAVPFAHVEDLEATRINAPGRLGERFVLQFSTGESSTVYGTGLIGRKPVPEPGEYFDQLLTVVDPSRSVSKTHLEFGQELSGLWVMDRYSGNGTVLREPDAPAIRCQAGRRYRVVRGTRVEIGEQFFIVS